MKCLQMFLRFVCDMWVSMRCPKTTHIKFFGSAEVQIPPEQLGELELLSMVIVICGWLSDAICLRRVGSDE